MEYGTSMCVYRAFNHFGQLTIEEAVAISWLAYIQMIEWNGANATDARI